MFTDELTTGQLIDLMDMSTTDERELVQNPATARYRWYNVDLPAESFKPS